MRWRPARIFLGAGAACGLLMVAAIIALLGREHSPVLPTPVDMPDNGPRQVSFPQDFGSLSSVVPFAGGISPVPTDVSPPAEHAPEFRDVAWLKAQNPDNFTLQVFAARDEESVKRFLAGRDDRAAYVYFMHPQDGASWYVVVTGSFATRELAAGLADTRGDLPGRPFPKRMGAYLEAAPATPAAAVPAPAPTVPAAKPVEP